MSESAFRTLGRRLITTVAGYSISCMASWLLRCAAAVLRLKKWRAMTNTTPGARSRRMGRAPTAALVRVIETLRTLMPTADDLEDAVSSAATSRVTVGRSGRQGCLSPKAGREFLRQHGRAGARPRELTAEWLRRHLRSQTRIIVVGLETPAIDSHA